MEGKKTELRKGNRCLSLKKSVFLLLSLLTLEHGVSWKASGLVWSIAGGRHHALTPLTVGSLEDASGPLERVEGTLLLLETARHSIRGSRQSLSITWFLWFLHP